MDNPIYKTCTSSTSLINNPENGLRHNTTINNGTSRLRAVGSERSNHQAGTTIHSNLVTEAENPQYGTAHMQPPQTPNQKVPPNLTPPPSQKAPRYTKVNVPGVVEPTYELIRGGNGVAVKIHSELPHPAGEDPVYSIPNPVKQEVDIPLYESTMDIPAIAGKDGDYAKLNYDKS